MSTGKIELSVGAVKIANKYEIFTEEEVDIINNKIPELDRRAYDIEDDIEEINSSLETIKSEKATKSEVDFERKRIDNLSKLGEGSTTGDAELIDGRIAYDGTIYNSLGDGLREQFSDTNYSIKNLECKTEYIKLENGFIDGKRVSSSTGELVSGSNWSATGFIDISSISEYLYVSITQNEYHYFAFYDNDKNYLSGAISSNTIGVMRIKIPLNAKYFRASLYTIDKGIYYVKGQTKITNSILLNEKLTLKNNNFNKYEFEFGTIDPSTGSTARSSIRIRTKKYISSNILNIEVDSDYNFMVFGYVDNKYIGAWNDDKNIFETKVTWIKKANLLNAKESYPNISFKIVLSRISQTVSLDDAENILLTKERYTTVENYREDNIENIDIVYFIDGENGDDNNDGSELAPFKTIAKALDKKGNILFIKGGVYKEPIFISGKRKVKILPSDWLYPYAEEGLVERKKIILDLSEEINLITSSENGLLECSYSTTADSYIYKVFVDKSLPIINDENVLNGRRDAFNCTLWEVYDNDKKGDYRLEPVLSLQECKNTVGSFYYNGAKIYVNPNSKEYNPVYKFSGNVDVGVEIRGCNEVVIEDLVVKYSRGANFYLRNLDNATFRGCEGRNASIRNGFRMMNVNGVFYGCKGNNNRADGIALQMFGRVDFFDCEASWNGDDGISPHDGCFGSINNSIFHHNTKGGVSSVNGACYNLSNVISHNNEFGFLLTYTENTTKRNIHLSNCVAYENKTGLCVSRSNFLAYNCKFVKNELNKQIVNTATYIELDSLTD